MAQSSASASVSTLESSPPLALEWRVLPWSTNRDQDVLHYQKNEYVELLHNRLTTTEQESPEFVFLGTQCLMVSKAVNLAMRLVLGYFDEPNGMNAHEKLTYVRKEAEKIKVASRTRILRMKAAMQGKKTVIQHLLAQRVSLLAARQTSVCDDNGLPQLTREQVRVMARGKGRRRTRRPADAPVATAVPVTVVSSSAVPPAVAPAAAVTAPVLLPIPASVEVVSPMLAVPSTPTTSPTIGVKRGREPFALPAEFDQLRIDVADNGLILPVPSSAGFGSPRLHIDVPQIHDVPDPVLSPISCEDNDTWLERFAAASQAQQRAPKKPRALDLPPSPVFAPIPTTTVTTVVPFSPTTSGFGTERSES